MPLERLVLILVVVIGGAMLTVWIGALLVASFNVPYAMPILALPALLVGYIIWRVIADRVQNDEDTHYDNIEK